MTGGFTEVDLSKLPAPDLVEVLDYEVVLAEMLADLKARDPEFSALVESDPAYKILEVAAFREVLVRQRVNDAGRAVMLAYAEKADLDNLGALFRVERLVIDRGDPDALPPVDPTYEQDDDYRRRIQLSLEGYSTAGPEGAYIFHSLSADGRVLDASADAPRFKAAELDPALQAQIPADVICLEVEYSAGLAEPQPGDVVVSVLSRDGDGSAPADLVAAVDSVLSSEAVRPLTDNVHVRSSGIVSYAVAATLYFYAGPDRSLVMVEADKALRAYIEQQHRMGRDVAISGVLAALHQPGVQRVELASPAANVVVDRQSASYCTNITLTDGGIDE